MTALLCFDTMAALLNTLPRYMLSACSGFFTLL